MGCELLDGLVAIGGCDKNMPGCLMAIARLNRPSVFVYGGTILPGCFQKRDVDIVSVFEAVGAHAAGKMSDGDLQELEQCAIPGPGSCGGMYTANTMASAIEALGMEPAQQLRAGTRSPPRRRRTRSAPARPCTGCWISASGPLDIMTKKAFENAITVVIALGGSTNAVLHLLAIAHAAGVKLTVDDFTRIGKRVPVLADLKPSGKYVMAALVAIGGLTPLMKMLLDRGLLHGDCLTVTGRTVAENLKDVKPYPKDQDVIHGFDNPDQADEPPGGVLRQSRAAGRRRQNHRQGGREIYGHRARVRFRGGRAAGDPGRQDQEGPRGGYPLRRAEGRPGHEGNALADLGDFRTRAGQRRGADHRRPLLRRHARFRGRAHFTRGARGADRSRW